METVEDLIKIGKTYETYKEDTDVYFNIDLKVLYNLVEPLKELQCMIGLAETKATLVNNIVFYIQHLENRNNDYLNTLIYGNPGTGKSRIGHIIAKIYGALGFLPKGHVVSVKADECIGAAVGQTGIKTRAVLEKSLGGVLIIDEAYSLGNRDNKSYVDDFVGTFLSFSSEHKGEFACILMGYKNCIEENILNTNKGLRRRFPNVINIENYKINELRDILITKIKEYEWYYEEDALPISLFEKHKTSFQDNGGSMENLFREIKFIHATRVLYLPPEKKKTLTLEDFENGLTTYIKMIKLHDKTTDSMINHMYM
jgi:SpoVK/Ycf46/Vps4 family AAA+-type ATPase